MSEIQFHPDANVRSSMFYVARTNAECPHCGESTRLIALVLPQDHETCDEDEGEAEAETETDDRDRPVLPVWQRANADAVLFYVEYLSDQVRDELERMLPSFHEAYSAVIQDSYWANHCEHCGTLFEDHEMHCEPEGAFMPSSESAATAIRLSVIQTPFEAAAGGYTLAPEFFRFVPRP